MNTLTKIIALVLGTVTVSSLFAAKKVNDILDISSQLKYSLAGLPHSLSWSKKTLKLDIKIENPTDYNLDASNFSMSNIRLTLPNGNVIASSPTKIDNVTIPAHSNIVVNDFVVKITISLFDIGPLIKNINNLIPKADIYARGTKIYSI